MLSECTQSFVAVLALEICFVATSLGYCGLYIHVPTQVLTHERLNLVLTVHSIATPVDDLLATKQGIYVQVSISKSRALQHAQRSIRSIRSIHTFRSLISARG